MDESKNAVKDAPQATGQPSESKEGSTSTGATKTHTDADIQKAISDALAKAGREAKALEAREQKLKDIETREKALIQQEEAAQKARDEAELTAILDDPDKLSVYQYRKKVKEAEEVLKTEKAKFEAEKASHQEELTFARKVKRSTVMGEIAGEFKDSDPEELEKMADTLGIGSEPEKIRALASVKWAKLDTKTEETSEVKPDSGVTNGGNDTSKLSAEEKFNRGLEQERKRK
jgi:hypothetical protein